MVEPINFVSAFVGAAILFILASFIHGRKFAKPYLKIFTLLQGGSLLAHGIYGVFCEYLKVNEGLSSMAAAYYSFCFLATVFLVKHVSFPLDGIVSLNETRMLGSKISKLRPSYFIIAYAIVMASLAFLPGAVLSSHLMGFWYMVGAIGFLAGYFQTLFWVFWFYWHHRRTVLKASILASHKGEIAIFVASIVSIPIVMILHPYADQFFLEGIIHVSVITTTIIFLGVAIPFASRSFDQFFWAFSSGKQVDLLKTAFQQSSEGMAITDVNGQVLFANSSWAEMHGCRRNELLGKDADFVYNAEQLKKVRSAQKSLFSKGSWNGEIDHTRKDGTVFPTLTTVNLMRDSGGKAVAILYVSRDVTQRRRMQRKLEEFSQQLERLVERRTRQLKEAQKQLLRSERLAAIGEIAAMVGHDLRNPLTSIAAAVHYLKTKLDLEMDGKAKEMLELIDEDVEYSDEIISDLLEYSKKLKLKLTETTPKLIVREALSLINIPKAVQVLDFTKNKPRIKVDLEKMKRVFTNLIKNAVDAMPEGGKLRIESRRVNESLEIVFTDNGIGISKDILEKIWTPLFTTKAKGMGLGLSICKRIVEAHRGQISSESTIGKGSTFSVTIPLKIEFETHKKIRVDLPESLSLKSKPNLSQGSR